ncbi:MAG: MMPL family transporter, partial [Deltaproteobacteria bacterium]
MSQRKDNGKTGAGRGSGLTERLARASALHPWRTIGLWTVLVVLAVLAVGSLLGSGLTSEMKFRAAKPDSLVGQELLQQRLTGPQKVTDFVIVRSAELTVDDAAFKAYVADVANRIQALGPEVVAGVATYYQTNDPTAVSKDGHSTLIPVVMAGKMDDALENVDKLHETVVAAQGQGFTLAQTGDASINEMFTKLAEKDLQRGEILGVPAALIVLLIVFGAVLAAFMPLAMSVISILLALALTALIGQVYPMNTFVLNILTMMGLAVGIDYTLFVISRYREERGRGLEKIDAIAATGATANRAIFFSGMTVVLAMSGMVIIPLDIMISMGMGVMLVVVTTLLTALILLPAVLSLLGDHINALRVPFVGKSALKRANGSGGLWERLAHSIMGRPVVWLTVAVVALLVVAAPVVVMKKGNNTASAAHLPNSEYAKQGWDSLDRDFSLGKANPLMIVVDGQAASPDIEQAVDNLQTAMKADGRFGPAQVTANEAGDLTLITTTLAGDPAGEATQSLVRHLRSNIVPAATDGTSAKVYVTGNTAGVVDYLGFFDTWMPVALAVVLSLSFVLLLVAFRSIVIPAQAIAMNLLSVGAAYGLMVLVFQKGVG